MPLQLCSRRGWAVVLALAGLLLVSGAARAGEWWEDAAEQTKDEFKAVTDSVSQTVDTLQKAEQQLEQFERWARGTLKGDELKQALDKVSELRGTLSDYTKPLATFSEHASKAGDAVSALFEIKDLAQQASQRAGGQGAKALHVLAWLMNKYGDKVPLVGAAIQAYGQVTMGLLDATDKIAKAIKENQDQGMIGTGQHNYQNDPKYQALVRQFGKNFADAHTLAPGDVPYVYEPIGPNPGWSLVWDPAKRQWYKVDQPASFVAKVYRDRLLVKGTTDPGLLAGLASLHDAVTRHESAGTEALALWQKANKYLLGPVAEAFDEVNKKHNYDLWTMLGDERLFKARYVYDSRYRAQVQQIMRELYEEILTRGGKAPAIEQWAQKYGVKLPQKPQQPQQPPAGQQQAGQQQGGQQAGQGQPQQPSQPTAPAAGGPVELSIVFLVDCSGSMGGEKIAAAKKAVASSVQRTNDGKTEWALLSFGACRVWEEVGFTRDAASVVQAANQLSTGGDTPLTYAMYKAVAYLAKKGHGKTGRLVILCDGQDNCDERHSVSQQEAMAGLRTLIRTVTPAGGNP